MRTTKKCILALVFVLASLQTRAQGHDVILSGDFRDLSFSEFVRTVEQTTDARFFYLKDWIEGIKISISGEEISLQETLSSVLPQAGLHFYIGEDLRVLITSEEAIISTLPDYSFKSTSEGISNGADTEKDLTKIEQRYVEGRKAGLRKTIVVGYGNGNTNQSGVIVNGKMVERESGEPLIGATIHIQELKKGAVTDVDGRYSIVLPPGKYTVDFSCMGMETENYYLEVLSGGNLDIFMDKGLFPLKEVVIKANRFDNVKGMQMGFEQMNYKTVKEIPVVFGEKDLLRVAQMLPGVQNVGEGTIGFNVRGSAADQNMIYVKKVPVYNSSHLFGFFSAFSPDIVKDFSLYKSNLPAKYGGRLASFLDITTRQGNMHEYTARGGISPITGHLAVEGPVVKNKSAFVLSARSTYSDWILKQLDDFELRNSNASFYDLAGTLTWEPNKNNLIKTFGYYSKDKFSLGSDNQYEYSNAGASIDLNHRFNSRISGDMAAVFGEYAFQAIDKTIDLFAYSQDYRIGHYEMKADFTWLSLGAHKLSFGGNAIFYILDRGYVKPYGEISLKIPVNLGVEKAVENALYFADEFTITPRLTLYGGLRYSYYLALGPDEVLNYAEGLPKKESNISDTLRFKTGQVIKRYSGLEPRIALNYLLGSDNSVKFSYNRVRQFLFMLSNTIAL
ncbi:TonB-dependent receptor domain-containing protein, partial [Bacteroidota bacterium]